MRLEPVLEHLESLRFDDDDLRYLASLDLFDGSFLDVLGDLRFTGDVWAVPEGLPVFGDEPLLRVTALLAEAQLVETALLNRICYSSLVASNAAQLAVAARGKSVLEFGARRAHGPDGALTGARAALIGGCAATSNVAAGRRYDVAVSGTMAHAWVMAFASELESFRAYARAFPRNCVLLVDTYDTLGSGSPTRSRSRGSSPPPAAGCPGCGWTPATSRRWHASHAGCWTRPASPACRSWRPATWTRTPSRRWSRPRCPSTATASARRC